MTIINSLCNGLIIMFSLCGGDGEAIISFLQHSRVSPFDVLLLFKSMKLLDSNPDNNSLVEMEFVCKKMFVVVDTWKNKAKVYNKDAQQGYL